MRTLAQSIASLSCFLLWGCETSPTPETEHPAKAGTAYFHSYSKFPFPRRVEQFRFVGSQENDRYGKDVSVGYNSPAPIVATVYVYPAPKDVSLLPGAPVQGINESLIDHEFASRKAEILHAHSDAVRVSEGPCEIVQGTNHFNGRKAVYSLWFPFGFHTKDSFSELYIFLIEPGVRFPVSNRQFVEYRMTYPVTTQSQATNEIASFLSELTWPVKE